MIAVTFFVAMVFICDTMLVDWVCDVIANVNNGWGKCIITILAEIYACDVTSCFAIFLNISYFMF